MAQTTRLVSFGPVFVVAAFPPSSCRIFHRLEPIPTIKQKLGLIKHERKKKTLTTLLLLCVGREEQVQLEA
jgi:hypothetical protein